MAGFDAASANIYDERITRVMPGYATLMELTAAHCRATVPDNGHILVVGAGTGAELVRLCNANPTWLFTAIDPSVEMLNMARRKVDQIGAADRVTYRACAMEDFDASIAFDGATSILVGHFVPDDGARLRFYKSIAGALAKNAPFICVETIGAAKDDLTDRTYEQWGIVVGNAPGKAKEMAATVNNRHVGLTDERLTQLFESASLGAPKPFFRALGFAGYCTERV